MINNEILIYTELSPDLKIPQVIFELSAISKKLSEKLNNAKISAVIINKCTNYDEIKNQLAKHGFEKVYLIKNDFYSVYSTQLYTNALCELIKEIKPAIVLFGATKIGRDLAPRVSARLNLGLTADCTELDINEDGKLAATRPTFGGQLMATILSKSETQMATVRPNVFKAIESNNSNLEVEEKFYNTTHVIDRTELIDFKRFKNELSDNLTEAEIIVSGGRGMKGKDGFALLKEFADLIGAKVGASRVAVDLGWAEQSIQIGQTGKTVTPKIYIACGISGAIQHLVGINSSDKIIAINNDPNAPIFKNSDYGIVGDVYEVLPKIIEELQNEKDSGRII